MLKKYRESFRLIDKPLLIICLIMFIFGLLNIVTSSSREAATWDAGIYHYFFRQLAFLCAGGGIALILINYPIRKYNTYIIIALVALIIILSYSVFEPLVHRGSGRWVEIFGFKFQPGEFAKPLMVIITAILLDKYQRIVKRKPVDGKKLLNILFVIGLAIPALIFLQKDFGNAFIVLSIFLFIFLVSNIAFQKKLNYLFFMVLLAFASMGLLFITTGQVFEAHQIRRLDFLQPCTKYEDTGYQICNAYIAINEGGLFGVGIGNSRQKYSYIDEPHTDMVFAIITEEYGVIVSGFILFLYTLIMVRMLIIANASKSPKLKYIAYGIMFYMFLQIFINLAGLFGLIPLTGVTLPFLSYGGSFTIAFIFALTIVFRISIENRMAKVKLKKI